MSKDALDNGSAINVADYVEASFNTVTPTAYPSGLATINRTIDGDSTSYYRSGDEVEIDLGKVYKIKKLVFRVANLVSYTVSISQTNAASGTLYYTPIPAGDLSYANGVITYTPSTAQDIRWVKIEYTGRIASSSIMAAQ